jgi:hypothetical protein
VATVIAAGDFNGDGRIDIAVYGQPPGYINSQVQIFFDSRNGTLQPGPITPMAAENSTGSIASADFSRGKAKEALERTSGVLERLELTLNEKKTSIRNARQERFDFLGYTFGPHINPRGGGRYMGYSPSQ